MDGRQMWLCMLIAILVVGWQLNRILESLTAIKWFLNLSCSNIPYAWNFSLYINFTDFVVNIATVKI